VGNAQVLKTRRNEKTEGHKGRAEEREPVTRLLDGLNANGSERRTCSVGDPKRIRCKGALG